MYDVRIYIRLQSIQLYKYFVKIFYLFLAIALIFARMEKKKKRKIIITYTVETLKLEIIQLRQETIESLRIFRFLANLSASDNNCAIVYTKLLRIYALQIEINK